jgi:hypothetical protein
LQVGHVKSLSFKAGLKKESKEKIKRKIVADGQRNNPKQIMQRYTAQNNLPSWIKRLSQ